MKLASQRRSQSRSKSVRRISRGNSGATLSPLSPGWNTVIGRIQEIGAEDRISVDINGDNQEVWPKTAAWFLGPKAENHDLLKELVNLALDQHTEFRRFKYFPLDPQYVTEKISSSSSFKDAVTTIKGSLMELSKRLNNSVPFFSFRSQGHMLWDTTIASNVGYIAALLYNQNNVASMASGVTLQLEREVAMDLCRMVGYKVGEDAVHTTEAPLAWGHLPNGGTVANIEAMWAARCLKFHAIAIKKMMEENFSFLGLEEVYETFTFKSLSESDILIKEASVWELLNVPIDEAIDMFDHLLEACKKHQPDLEFDTLFKLVKTYTLEERGVLEFFDCVTHYYEEGGVRPSCGKWFVPGSRHYSWDKGANMLGHGRNSMVKVSVDIFCRMDLEELKRDLENCLAKKIPVVGVVAVFGTTQEGAVDNLDLLLDIREDFEKRGLTFYIHVDGAWGGYFASCIVKTDGTRRWSTRRNRYKSEGEDKEKRSTMMTRANTVTFLESNVSTHFRNQLSCLEFANSITLDPHKSGFCPYPAGGLLYRNGNIRNFLAQKAAYVSHGSGKNEEINLYGIDGSKPGAASAGVWLSHKVIGLNKEGYGLLLRQSNFSAGIMYAMWSCLGKEKDPFVVIPAFPIKEEFKEKWSKKRIRNEIFDAETGDIMQNCEALEFVCENGPDTLINSVSINCRSWNKRTDSWENNKSIQTQRDFLDKFYSRCSHSVEKPAMVDKGIEVILNSTVWGEKTHSGAYRNMKGLLGLEASDSSDIGVIINTSMSPWLRAQATYKRLGMIIRNELYNAYGGVYDKPEYLHLVSPNILYDTFWEGDLFAELETSFSDPSLQYHAIGKFCIHPKDWRAIRNLALEAFQREEETGAEIPLRIVTRNKMKVWDLMTRIDEESAKAQRFSEHEDDEFPDTCPGDKLKKFSDDHLSFEEICMPEIEVTCYYAADEDSRIGEVQTTMKLKRVIEYQHLSTDIEEGYPQNQEYLLYTDDKNAYISHCPNKFPDFQQQIQLDKIPECESGSAEDKELYKEALRRGVIIYLPSIKTGGKPVVSAKTSPGGPVCRDPLTGHRYNAITWSDQGAFTGNMMSISLTFYNVGRRWFSGKKLNTGFDKQKFPHIYDSLGSWRKDEMEDDEANSYDSE